MHKIIGNGTRACTMQDDWHTHQSLLTKGEISVIANWLPTKQTNITARVANTAWQPITRSQAYPKTERWSGSIGRKQWRHWCRYTEEAISLGDEWRDLAKIGRVLSCRVVSITATRCDATRRRLCLTHKIPSLLSTRLRPVRRIRPVTNLYCIHTYP